MITFSITTADDILDLILRNGSYTPTSTVWLAFFKGSSGLHIDHEPTYVYVEIGIDESSYARQSITFGTPVNGVCNNTNEIVFPAATVDFTITHIAIMKYEVAGSVLFWSTLPAPIEVVIGEAVRIQAGELAVGTIS